MFQTRSCIACQSSSCPWLIQVSEQPKGRRYSGAACDPDAGHCKQLLYVSQMLRWCNIAAQAGICIRISD